MKWNDTTNTHDSLVHDVNFLLGGITNTDFALADKARATNKAKYILALKVLRNSDIWDWDDRGHADFHIVTTTLVDGQRDYSLEAEVLKLDHVEVKDSNGNYYKIDLVDQREILDRRHALTDYGETNGTPSCAWITKRSLWLDPAPDVANGAVTAAEGLRLYYARSVNEVTAATTTAEVGFDTEGDAIVSLMVAEEWAGVHRPDRLPALQQRRVEAEQTYLEHMSHRVRQRQPNMKVHMDINE